MARRPTRTGGKPTREARAVPRWAWLCTVLGALLMLLSSGVLVGYRDAGRPLRGRGRPRQDLFDDKAARRPGAKSNITGPLNILLVGVDVRPGSTDAPLADSDHDPLVPTGWTEAFLFSLPRDLLVEIPAFPKADFRGGTDKLNSAMPRAA